MSLWMHEKIKQNKFVENDSVEVQNQHFNINIERQTKMESKQMESECRMARLVVSTTLIWHFQKAPYTYVCGRSGELARAHYT